MAGVKIEDRIDLGSRETPIKIEDDYQPILATTSALSMIGSISELPELTPPRSSGSNRAWSDLTLLEGWFNDSPSQLKSILQFLNRDSINHQDFQELLPKIPASSGWFRPITHQLETLQNQSVILLVLYCPKKDCYINTELHDQSNFTEVFIHALRQCKSRRSSH